MVYRPKVTQPHDLSKNGSTSPYTNEGRETITVSEKPREGQAYNSIEKNHQKRTEIVVGPEKKRRPNDSMACYFQLLKLFSCHSNKCNRCLHSSQDNIYDSIKDTHSLSRVNNDRWFSVFLRKSASVLFLPLSEQLSFIALSWGREGRRDEEGDKVEAGKIQGSFLT